MGRIEVDLEDWAAAGRRLLAVDPGRFLALLSAAERIVQIHEAEDPGDLPPFSFTPPMDSKGSG